MKRQITFAAICLCIMFFAGASHPAESRNVIQEQQDALEDARRKVQDAEWLHNASMEAWKRATKGKSQSVKDRWYDMTVREHDKNLRDAKKHLRMLTEQISQSNASGNPSAYTEKVSAQSSTDEFGGVDWRPNPSQDAPPKSPPKSPPKNYPSTKNTTSHFYPSASSIASSKRVRFASYITANTGSIICGTPSAAFDQRDLDGVVDGCTRINAPLRVAMLGCTTYRICKFESPDPTPFDMVYAFRHFIR